jgi:hypothetical protein
MLGLGRAHALVARALLGPTDRERRVVQLERTRAGVVDDSAATLQRVERDLHDGTQARLITVAMALARAEEHFASSDVTRGRPHWISAWAKRLVEPGHQVVARVGNADELIQKGLAICSTDRQPMPVHRDGSVDGT